MALEQIPGNLDLKLVQGDDLNLLFNLPFDTTGYVFSTSVQEINSTTTISILTSSTVQSSILSILYVTFLASITNNFVPISNNDSHDINIGNSSIWKIRYIDNNGLTRTFISGYLEVVEIIE